MNKLMNLIGIKARKASQQNINTKIKNKVLKDYAKLIDKIVDDICVTIEQLAG